jgi:hypothetical protein
MKKLKVGIDVHGVIDTFPNDFKRLSAALIAAGHEVHIVTGLKYDGHIAEELAAAGIEYTDFFSIVDQLEEDGVEIEWRDGLPWAPDKPWNEAKSKYCEDIHMDIMIDDSYIYRDTFDNISTVFLHLINKDRKTYCTRPEVPEKEDDLNSDNSSIRVAECLIAGIDGARKSVEIDAAVLQDLIGTIKEQRAFINQVKGQ